jgi:hypothetical protein
VLKGCTAGYRRQVIVAVATVLSVVLVPQVSQHLPVAQAGAPLAQTGPTAAKPICAWPHAAIGKQRFGNVGFVDTYAAYLLTTFAYIPGPTLRIHGLFPYARYMSFTLYAGRSNVLIDRIADKDIVPDAGSINPFTPQADRQAAHRSYTITIRQGLAPPSGRAPNTLYTGPYHPILVMYRIYAPDQGADDFGNVPKPSIEYFNGPPENYTKSKQLPTCDTPQPARAALNFVITTPEKWQRFGSQGGAGVNGDEAYLQMRLDHHDADEFVLRFKAPTFADTYDGKRITGREDVRFWSMCMYDMISTRVIACLHDYEAVRSRAGYVTVLISTLANRPRSATQANGINWIPFGPEAVGMVTFRQLLPSPTFRGSFMNVAPDAYEVEMQDTLGRYLPTIQTCSLISFTPQTCSDQIDPTQCTDLTEPSPCGNAAPPLRSLARRSAAGLYRTGG